MSTPEKIALLTQARERGYQVALVVVTTDDRNVSMTFASPGDINIVCDYRVI